MKRPSRLLLPRRMRAAQMTTAATMKRPSRLSRQHRRQPRPLPRRRSRVQRMTAATTKRRQSLLSSLQQRQRKPPPRRRIAALTRTAAMRKRKQSQLLKLQQQLLNQLQLPRRRRAAPTTMTHQMKKRSQRNLQPRRRRAAMTTTAATRRKRSRRPKKQLPPRRQSRRTIAAARRIPLTTKMKSLQRKPHLLKRKSNKGKTVDDMKTPTKADQSFGDKSMSEEGRKIFIHNVGEEMVYETFQEKVEKFGEVTDFFNPGRGFAFITFSTNEEAQACIKGMDNTEVGGNTIQMNIARPKG